MFLYFAIRVGSYFLTQAPLFCWLSGSEFHGWKYFLFHCVQVAASFFSRQMSLSEVGVLASIITCLVLCESSISFRECRRTYDLWAETKRFLVMDSCFPLIQNLLFLPGTLQVFRYLSLLISPLKIRRETVYGCSLNVNIKTWFEFINMNLHICILWCFPSHCGIPAVDLQVVALVSCLLEVKYF